ncbi:ArsR/SmtB family transcription factor [Streptomyces paromomycinus]|uniref:Putative regulatory protein n=1 Tax=Streptomyces paromomycinus TaxID=92743 RepID=A0A401W464_STREY|nr:winged helix-turn-helix domain-containing protein [Streptomyces paromomycinus]GCD44096.1 putative regulatory protein [Streptomyces paromomycinus]
MIRIHFTAADFARVKFAPRPAPLQEMNTAFLKVACGDDPLLFGHWRQRLLRSLPRTVLPLRDLVPAGRAPSFLDVFSDSLAEGLDSVRATRPDLFRSEIRRIYEGSGSPPPPWLRDLYRGDSDAWALLRRAQRTAFETSLRPVWPLVQDLHREEFTRHALTVAEHGIATALTRLVSESRLHGTVWQLPAPATRNITLNGRGVLLLPTFHWTGHPLVGDHPGQPVTVTYPAGPGLPLTPTGAADPADALSAVLGRTRAAILALLAEPHSTTSLARRLGLSNATASAHTAALRGAGLLTTARVGRAVLHRRTDLGALLARRTR